MENFLRVKNFALESLLNESSAAVCVASRAQPDFEAHTANGCWGMFPLALSIRNVSVVCRFMIRLPVRSVPLYSFHIVVLWQRNEVVTLFTSDHQLLIRWKKGRSPGNAKELRVPVIT